MRILDTQPVRFFAWLGAIFSAAGSFFIDLGSDVRWQTALGKALGLLAIGFGAGELGKQRAYAPATADGIMDAHAVIERLEREGIDGPGE